MTIENAKPKHFYFMGICGTAMGAVAAAMKDLGHQVTGSDANVFPPMSTFLESKGISILNGFSPENVPADADVIVVGNAISRGNVEIEHVLNQRLSYVSLPEILKEFFLRGRRNLVVSGTHGKTTTSSMLAWILEHAGQAPDFMIGGIPANFGQGCRLGSASEFVVLEGDEYDTAFFDKRSKFVHYLPEVAIVNSIEFDHADIFDNLDQIKLSFRRMLNIVPGNGLIVLNGDDPNSLDAAKGVLAPLRKVGFSPDCDRQISNVEYSDEGSRFDFAGKTLFVPMTGEFNVRNAAMAAAAAEFSGLSLDKIAAGLATFKGVARRQQIRGVTDRNITVIDDFGHHPTAIGLTLTAMRKRYPNQRIWALFEPRSNTTRRKVFQQELPKVLSLADGICISSIPNPEKFPEDNRLDPDQIITDLNAMGRRAFHEADSDQIVARLQKEARDGDVIVVFSNGGFGNIHEKLLATL